MAQHQDDDADDVLIRALEAVALYTRLHLRLVPVDPHAVQCEAGAKAGDISPSIARAVYRAMLAASET
jgi:hypothetical protein